MRKREQYKPTAKTIVTEVRQTMVDAVRRMSAGRQSVACEILDTTLNQLDIVIGPDRPYILKDVRQYLSISTPFPIGLELVAFGEIEPAEERVEPKQFNTATMEIEPVIAGKFINVAIFDPDLFGATVNVECFNTNSGETEYVTLHCVRKNEYRGFIQSRNSLDAGMNFDGTMFCKDADVLRFTYTDPQNEHGLSQDIVADIVVVSPVKATTVMVQDYMISGESIRVAIYNGSDAPFQSFNVVNENTGTTMDGLLEPSREQPDVLIGSIPLGPDDTADAMGVSTNDVLTISYEHGHDSTGISLPVKHTALVKNPETVVGKVTAQATVKMYSDLPIEVQDFDLFTSEVEVFLTNKRTNISVPAKLKEVWPGMSIFRGAIGITPEIGLPGDILEITYSDYGPNGTNVLTTETVIASHVEHVDPVVAETPEPLDTSISKPVQLTINGLFLLNGSFAGTLKLSALDNNDVRCTIIKA